MVVDLNKTQPSEKNKNIRVTELLPQKLYRGDSNKYNAYDIDNLLDGEYKFFGLTPEEVHEYGVTFEFTLNRPLYLVRLDDKNTRNELYKIGDAKIKEILESNYGHNEDEIRVSEEKADYEMSSFICKDYDGYITDKMKSDRIGGKFHREIMICNPINKFSKVEQITKPEQANKLRTEYSLKLHELKEKKTRKKKNPRLYLDVDDENINRMQIQPISELSYLSPVKTGNKLSFETPPRTTDNASRSLFFDTPGGRKRKSRKMRKSKKRQTKKRGGKMLDLLMGVNRIRGQKYDKWLEQRLVSNYNDTKFVNEIRKKFGYDKTNIRGRGTLTKKMIDDEICNRSEEDRKLISPSLKCNKNGGRKTKKNKKSTRKIKI